MKKTLLAICALSIISEPALAETRWFIGAGIGYTEPVFSDAIDDLIDDDFFDDNSGTITPYFSAGLRFGERDKIYNGGASITFSYMSKLGDLSDGDTNPLYMDAEIDAKTLYLSYDNYVCLGISNTEQILSYHWGWAMAGLMVQ